MACAIGKGTEVLGLRPGRVLMILVVLTLVTQAISWTGILVGSITVLPLHFLFNGSLATTLAAGFLIHVLSCPRPREITATVGVAIVVGAGIWLWAGSLDAEVSIGQIVLEALGGGSFVVLGVRALVSRNGNRREALELLATGAMMVAFVPPALYFLHLTGILLPYTLDPIVHVADLAFPGPVPLLAMRLVDNHPWLLTVLGITYVSFPLVMALIHVLERRMEVRPAVGVLAMFLAIVVVGYTLYLFFPVAGPIYAYEAVYRGHEPVVAEFTSSWLAVTAVPRNCWPSLHTSWAILFWWHSRPFRLWVRILAAVFLILTLLATVGMGLHYVVDLIVAYPFTLAVRSGRLRLAGADSPALKRSIWIGAALVATWFFFLRVVVPTWPPAHIGVWTLSIITLGITAWLRWTTREAPGPASTTTATSDETFRLPLALGTVAGLAGIAFMIFCSAIIMRLAPFFSNDWAGLVLALAVLGAYGCITLGVSSGHSDLFFTRYAWLAAYAAIGVAVGALGGGWFLLPALGATSTALLGGILAILAAFLLWKRSRVDRKGPAVAESQATLNGGDDSSRCQGRPIRNKVFYVVTAMAGLLVISIGLATLLIQLDVHTGGGTYAPFRSSLAIASGAAVGFLAAQWLRGVFKGVSVQIAVLACLVSLALGYYILSGVPFWSNGLVSSPLPRLFGAREVARAVVSFAIISPVAAAGATLLALAFRERKMRILAILIVAIGPLFAFFARPPAVAEHADANVFAPSNHPLPLALVSAILDDVTNRRGAIISGLDEASSAAVRDAGFATTEIAPLELRTALKQSHGYLDFVAVDVSRSAGSRFPPFVTTESLAIGRERLDSHGVLVIFAPIDRLPVADVLSLLATMRAVFPKVYVRAHSLVMAVIGCVACNPSGDALLLLSPDATDSLLRIAPARLGLDTASLFTDDLPGLEFSLPRDEGGPRQAKATIEMLQSASSVQDGH